MRRPRSRLLVVAGLGAAAVIVALAAGCGGSEESTGTATETAAATTGTTTTTPTSALRAALVADAGQLNDNGFNELAYKGLKRAERELGIKGRVVEAQSAADYIPNMRQRSPGRNTCGWRCKASAASNGSASWAGPRASRPAKPEYQPSRMRGGKATVRPSRLADSRSRRKRKPSSPGCGMAGTLPVTSMSRPSRAGSSALDWKTQARQPAEPKPSNAARAKASAALPQDLLRPGRSRRHNKTAAQGSTIYSA